MAGDEAWNPQNDNAQTAATQLESVQGQQARSEAARNMVTQAYEHFGTDTDGYRSWVDQLYSNVHNDSQNDPTMEGLLPTIDLVDNSTGTAGSDRAHFEPGTPGVVTDENGLATSQVIPGDPQTHEGAAVINNVGQVMMVKDGKVQSSDGVAVPGGTVTGIDQATGKITTSDNGTNREYDPSTGAERSTVPNPNGGDTPLSVVNRNAPGGMPTSFEGNVNGQHQALQFGPDGKVIGGEGPMASAQVNESGQLTWADGENHFTQGADGKCTSTRTPEGGQEVTTTYGADGKPTGYAADGYSISRHDDGKWWYHQDGGSQVEVGDPTVNSDGTIEARQSSGLDSGTTKKIGGADQTS